MTTPKAKEEHPPTLSARTMRKIERASGSLATASVSEMEERLPWPDDVAPTGVEGTSARACCC